MSLNNEMEEGTAATPVPSCVSMRSTRSMSIPDTKFSSGVLSSNLRKRRGSLVSKTASMQRDRTPVQPLKHDDERGTRQHDTKTGDLQLDSQQPVDDVLQRVKNQHKTSMKNKYECLSEGTKHIENQTLLNRIFTQLYIIEGESEGVNEEHEVLHMEKNTRTRHLQDTPIFCNDIFTAEPEGHETKKRRRKDEIKTVLTKGIAGIGKTVSVQKFILDWAEGIANRDVDFMFVLPFRELNLIQNERYSLHKLLLDFHPELQDLDSKIYDVCKVVFIFDGLDENRFTLTFSDGEKVSDVTETSSIGVLMSNLIKGDLLPSALIWITSRPAAANQIPSKCISRMTEIQGFNDAQKDEYFRKRISDQHQASRIISHIRKTRSLHIMCHIPVFCWISSTVLQNILKQDNDRAEIPKTLTEMYVHFLLIQIDMKNQKYDERHPKNPLQSRKLILKLAELAYKQLMKHKMMFYEEDLKECGIDITDASLYSGICTEIFKEESLIHQKKVFCFIHLSCQEFLAAFYVFYYYVFQNTDTVQFLNVFQSLHREAIDKALKSETGHLDLFLRFLLGISMESNQRLLQDLLTCTHDSSETIRQTTEYIKNKIRHDALSAERSINLFLCLLEVNDQTLYREIEAFVTSDKQEKKLSTAQCSAIAYILQMSENVLDELDLEKYNTTEEGKRRLIPAVTNCSRALLANCNLTGQYCNIVASSLQSTKCLLTELDLSNNDLKDSGVKVISDALKSHNCTLQMLRLSGCMVTEEGCCYLATSLRSNPSHLRELDLSYNHPGHAGVQLLTERVNDPNCKLKNLNLDHGDPCMIRPGLRKYACALTLDLNTTNIQLKLSEGNRRITHVSEPQPYPKHPDRFEGVPQIMCKEGLTGRCYWEAEWDEWARIAVTYKGISRKEGSNSMFGLYVNSWNLFCTVNGFNLWHNNTNKDIPVTSVPSKRIGVYLDWPAGTLSFYSVSDTDTLTHIHTVKNKFTEPLYAGFMVHHSVSLCQI